MSMLHVLAACLWNLNLHVHASCPCWMSIFVSAKFRQSKPLFRHFVSGEPLFRANSMIIWPKTTFQATSTRDLWKFEERMDSENRTRSIFCIVIAKVKFHNTKYAMQRRLFRPSRTKKQKFVLSDIKGIYICNNLNQWKRKNLYILLSWELEEYLSFVSWIRTHLGVFGREQDFLVSQEQAVALLITFTYLNTAHSPVLVGLQDFTIIGYGHRWAP
jgi:hypothetical protein